MYTVLIDDSGEQTKKINIQTGFHVREAYRFAIKKINERRVLPGYSLSEQSVSTLKSELYSAILNTFYLSSMPVICPVGPQNMFKIALLSEPLNIPLVSHSDSNINKATYIFRTMPADEYRVSAVLSIVKILGWNYIAVLSSSGESGETTAKMFVKHVFNLKICSAKNVALPSEPTTTDYLNAIKDISSVNANVKGLVLFTNNRDSIGLAKAMAKVGVKGKFQILAASGFTNYIEIAKGFEEYLEGAISIDYSSKELPEFRDHFLALKVDLKDEASIAFWEETFSCNFTNQTCTGKENISEGMGYYPITPITPVINSVFSLAYAIRSFIENTCPKPACDLSSKKYFIFLQGFLLNNSFPDYTVNLTDPLTDFDPSNVSFDIFNFVSNGSGFRIKKVGSWFYRRNQNNTYQSNEGLRLHEGKLILNLSEIQWINKRGIVESSCRLPCKGGEVRVTHPDTKISRCCWSCVKCGSNMISVNNTCFDCGVDSKPDSQMMSCIPLEIRHFSNDQGSGRMVWVYIGISAVGIFSTAFVIMMFIRNDSNIVVRSAGRELCYVILTGICLLFLMPITFVAAPSSEVCSVRYLMPGLAFCICYSPLFLKINRIYRIFVNAQSTTAQPQLTSPKSQLFMVACFVSVQLLLGVVWIISEVPKPEKTYHKAKGYVLHSCSNEAIPLVLNLILSVGLMCCCTWYAFKTRNFPKNYNESKYIGFTMYITSLCWALFLSTYFLSTSDDLHVHEHLTCALVIVIAFVSLAGLFGQRMQMLLLPTDAQRQRHFSQLAKQEADPNQFQMRTYSLRSMSLTRTVSRLPAKASNNDKN